MKKQGNINVTSENIFPIIKQFLYSDHEIFLRELVSNAVDATQKNEDSDNNWRVENRYKQLKS
jgi:HSP90 family molecular chaperone